MNSTVRSYLRKMAQSLHPVVMVGKNGGDERVIQALDEALTIHELVKVKFVDFKDSRKEISQIFAEKTHAELVHVIGNTAVFFRTQVDPDKRKIHVPGTWKK